MMFSLLLLACSGSDDDDGDDGPSDTDTDTATAPTGQTGDSAAPSCFDLPATVEPGTYDPDVLDVFVGIAELDPVPIVFGSQGGYHMNAAVRSCSMDALFTASITVTDEASGTVLSDSKFLVPSYEEDGCCRVRADLQARFSTNDAPEPGWDNIGDYLDGKVVIYDLSAWDDLGNTADATIRLTAVFDGG